MQSHSYKSICYIYCRHSDKVTLLHSNFWISFLGCHVSTAFTTSSTSSVDISLPYLQTCRSFDDFQSPGYLQVKNLCGYQITISTYNQEQALIIMFVRWHMYDMMVTQLWLKAASDGITVPSITYEKRKSKCELLVWVNSAAPNNKQLFFLQLLMSPRIADKQ